MSQTVPTAGLVHVEVQQEIPVQMIFLRVCVHKFVLFFLGVIFLCIFYSTSCFVAECLGSRVCVRRMELLKDGERKREEKEKQQPDIWMNR